MTPNVFAVLRLMMRSNLVGCSPGRSADVAPLEVPIIPEIQTLSSLPRCLLGIYSMVLPDATI